MKALKSILEEIKEAKYIFLISLAVTIVYGVLFLAGFIPVINKVVIGDIVSFLPREVAVKHSPPLLDFFSFFILLSVIIFSLDAAEKIYSGEKKEKMGDDKMEEKLGIMIAGVIFSIGLSFLPNMIFALLVFACVLLFLSFFDRIYILMAYLGLICLLSGIFVIGNMTVALLSFVAFLLLFRPLPIAQFVAVVGFIIVAICAGVILVLI